MAQICPSRGLCLGLHVLFEMAVLYFDGIGRSHVFLDLTSHRQRFSSSVVDVGFHRPMHSTLQQYQKFHDVIQFGRIQFIRNARGVLVVYVPVAHNPYEAVEVVLRPCLPRGALQELDAIFALTFDREPLDYIHIEYVRIDFGDDQRHIVGVRAAVEPRVAHPQLSLQAVGAGGAPRAEACRGRTKLRGRQQRRAIQEGVELFRWQRTESHDRCAFASF